MARHLFDLTGYGISHVGEIVKETERTFTVRHGDTDHGYEARRVKDNNLIAIETDDWKATLERARLVWIGHDAEIRAMHDAIMQANRARRAETLEALK